MYLLRILLSLVLTGAFIAPLNLNAGFADHIKGFFSGRQKQPPSKIKILVGDDLEGAQIEVVGRYSLHDPYTNSHISTRFVGKNKYMQSLHTGLKWGEQFPGIYQLKIMPEDRYTAIYVDGVQYYGNIYVYEIEGKISIVNEIDIENYLKATLPKKFSDELSKETLAAIVLAARTNAYYQAVNPRNPYWAIDAEKVGYEGPLDIEFDHPILDVIDETRHMVMSKTGAYEGVTTPFPLQWEGIKPSKTGSENISKAKISLAEAEKMAQNGQHAAQILNGAFPGMAIMLAY